MKLIPYWKCFCFSLFDKTTMIHVFFFLISGVMNLEPFTLNGFLPVIALFFFSSSLLEIIPLILSCVLQLFRIFFSYMLIDLSCSLLFWRPWSFLYINSDFFLTCILSCSLSVLADLLLLITLQVSYCFDFESTRTL